MFRKLYAVLLSLSVTAAILPQSVYAEEETEETVEETSETEKANEAEEAAVDFEYTVDGSKITITKYTGTDTSVTILSKIDGLSVTKIYTEAFTGCNYLTSVTIPEGIETIGKSAFSGCVRLKNITIPDTVKNIDNYAFYNCKKLSKLTLPNSVTHIGAHAFTDYQDSYMIIPDSVGSIGERAVGWYRVKVSEYLPDPNWDYYISGYNIVEKINSGFVICGKAGSAAESYAAENGFTFKKKGSWFSISDKWYYFSQEGTITKGWKKISGKWYWFNSKGVMIKGWQKISGKWYYFGPGGAMAQNESESLTEKHIVLTAAASVRIRTNQIYRKENQNHYDSGPLFSNQLRYRIKTFEIYISMTFNSLK